MSNEILVHKKYQMGVAPYKLVGFWSMPSQTSAAYESAMEGRPSCCNGMCNHCGTGIVHHYIIKDAVGTTFAVGSSCIEKLNDTELLSAKKVMDRRAQIAKNNAKREAKWEAQMAELERQRQVNGGLTDVEIKIQARDAAEAIRIEPVVSIIREIANQLADGKHGFCDSISQQMLKGELPKGNAKSIVLDILAKSAGRTNSKKYNAKYDEVLQILNVAESIIL
jgi:hypothetical protein